MASRIVFVDEQNIHEVFGGEDSDLDEQTSGSERSEGEGDLFDEINSQTNKYARETIESLRRRDRLAQTSRFRSWPENGETSGEIKAFLALIVAMGLVNQEDIRDYWSTDEVLSTPFFSQIMSRDKFMNFLSFFHLSDNDSLFLEDRQGITQSASLVTHTLLSLKNSQVFGSQD